MQPAPFGYLARDLINRLFISARVVVGEEGFGPTSVIVFPATYYPRRVETEALYEDPSCMSSEVTIFFTFLVDMAPLRSLSSLPLASASALFPPATVTRAARSFPRPVAAKLVQRRNMATQIPKIKVKYVVDRNSRRFAPEQY